MNRKILLVAGLLCCIYAIGVQAVARSYFKINPNALESIRDIINHGNKEALQSVSTEVLTKI